MGEVARRDAEAHQVMLVLLRVIPRGDLAQAAVRDAGAQ